MIAAFFLRSDAIRTSSGAINCLARSRSMFFLAGKHDGALAVGQAGNVEARVRRSSLTRSFSWLHRVA
jgi:hypothetical protein